MTTALTIDDVIAVLALGSVGKLDARVATAEAADLGDPITRIALAVNQLLGDLDYRSKGLQAQVEETRRQLEANQQLLETVRRQHQAILGLSVPTLLVEPGVLLVPIIGSLDRDRLDRLLDAALEAIHERGAGWVLLDLTGTLTLDAEAAAGLVKVAKAGALLGARVMLCGVSARLARELRSAHADLAGFDSVASVPAGIAAARAGVGLPHGEPPVGP